ncbi:hypothetical protein KQH54_03680 [bacterium]|nr:hypothetical protein [bacterium]
MVNCNIKTPVFREDGKAIGYIFGDVLCKNVSSEKHMLRRPKGWAWDADILDQAEKQGAVRIEIHDKQSGKTYHATIQDFWDNGIGFNRGFGDQIVLPLQYWGIRNPGEPPAQQLALAF